ARPLAVGARDRDDLVRRRPQLQLVDDRDHAVERQVDLLRMERLEPGEPVVEREVAARLGYPGTPPALRTAPGGYRAGRAARRSGRAPGGGRGSCRWRLSRAGIRRAESPRAASRP